MEERLILNIVVPYYFLCIHSVLNISIYAALASSGLRYFSICTGLSIISCTLDVYHAGCRGATNDRASIDKASSSYFFTYFKLSILILTRSAIAASKRSSVSL